MHIAGIALFLVFLAGFLFLLPGIGRLSDTPSTMSEVQRNNPTVQAVIEEPTPDAVVASSAPTTGGKGVQIEMLDLSGFKVGDPLALYIPQEAVSHEGSITEVNITKAGNRVITGFLDIDGTSHRFIFTVGRHQTFGTIQTGRGRYQLETREGEGRIISVARIKEGLDFSQPDYVVPSRRELPPVEPRDG